MWNNLWHHHFPHLHNTKTWISLKWKKIFQKRKRHSSSLWKPFYFIGTLKDTCIAKSIFSFNCGGSESCWKTLIVLTSFSLVRVGVISSVRIWNNQKKTETHDKLYNVQCIRLQELLSYIPHDLSLIPVECACTDLESRICCWWKLIEIQYTLYWPLTNTLLKLNRHLTWH